MGTSHMHKQLSLTRNIRPPHLKGLDEKSSYTGIYHMNSTECYGLYSEE